MLVKPTNKLLWAKANSLIPGGVNSPVRAWKAVGRDPIFLKRAKGSRVWDTCERAYIDYIMGWGPLILGHAHPKVCEMQQAVSARGTTFGMPTEEELFLAERVCAFFPSIEKLRLVNSGTEAAMTALRLARAVTGRSKIIKFDGCYHGHVDALLVQAGSGSATFGRPDSAGVSKNDAARTCSLPYNREDLFRSLMRTEGGQVAAVIVEPLAGNMGVVPADHSFLSALREETEKHGALLIFDEVMTGFRVAPGGVQSLADIRPDLTLLGKILGGGLPIGAVGGRAQIMDELSPSGPVYQAGTFSGNRLSVVSGLATLDVLAEGHIYSDLEEKSAHLEQGLREAARQADRPIQINRTGSMLTIFFSEQPVVDFETAQASDEKRFAHFFHALLEGGVLIPPSRFETWFVSQAHTADDIDQTIEKASHAFRASQ